MADHAQCTASRPLIQRTCERRDDASRAHARADATHNTTTAGHNEVLYAVNRSKNCSLVKGSCIASARCLRAVRMPPAQAMRGWGHDADGLSSGRPSVQIPAARMKYSAPGSLNHRPVASSAFAPDRQGLCVESRGITHMLPTERGFLMTAKSRLRRMTRP